MDHVPEHMSLEDGMGHPVFGKPLFKTGMYMVKNWYPDFDTQNDMVKNWYPDLDTQNDMVKNWYLEIGPKNTCSKLVSSKVKCSKTQRKII